TTEPITKRGQCGWPVTLLQRCLGGGILRDAGAKRFRFSCREPIMPFKLHSRGRRHIPRQRHRVTNWREYDVCLRNRGSLTIWFTRRSHEQRRAVSVIIRTLPSTPR